MRNPSRYLALHSSEYFRTFIQSICQRVERLSRTEEQIVLAQKFVIHNNHNFPSILRIPRSFQTA